MSTSSTVTASSSAPGASSSIVTSTSPAPSAAFTLASLKATSITSCTSSASSEPPPLQPAQNKRAAPTGRQLDRLPIFVGGITVASRSKPSLSTAPKRRNEPIPARSSGSLLGTARQASPTIDAVQRVQTADAGRMRRVWERLSRRSWLRVQPAVVRAAVALGLFRMRTSRCSALRPDLQRPSKPKPMRVRQAVTFAKHPLSRTESTSIAADACARAARQTHHVA